MRRKIVKWALSIQGIMANSIRYESVVTNLCWTCPEEHSLMDVRKTGHFVNMADDISDGDFIV
jgi:hypothetical protein